jgi:hypothetical protein
LDFPKEYANLVRTGMVGSLSKGVKQCAVGTILIPNLVIALGSRISYSVEKDDLSPKGSKFESKAATPTPAAESATGGSTPVPGTAKDVKLELIGEVHLGR